MVRKNFISVLLLAGGMGTRMGGSTPKQFQLLRGKALALYSFELFSHLEEVHEIVVVCDPLYRSLFSSSPKPVQFALPGQRRQDSVYHGLLAASPDAQLICIHDSARPFLEKETVLTLFKKAFDSGAAALATPATNTIKQADASQKVRQTLPREDLWEMQTPQAIRRDLLLKAYAHAQSNGIEATDDLSLVEAMGKEAVLVKSSSRNFKITTPFDWAVAEVLVVLPVNSPHLDRVKAPRFDDPERPNINSSIWGRSGSSNPGSFDAAPSGENLRGGPPCHASN